jgi:hypothetical protein
MSAGTVCLTFDFDAVSLWVSRGLRTPAPVSGGSSGLWRSREYSSCSTLVVFRPHGLSPGTVGPRVPDLWVASETVAVSEGWVGS